MNTHRHIDYIFYPFRYSFLQREFKDLSNPENLPSEYGKVTKNVNGPIKKVEKYRQLHAKELESLDTKVLKRPTAASPKISPSTSPKRSRRESAATETSGTGGEVSSSEDFKDGKTKLKKAKAGVVLDPHQQLSLNDIKDMKEKADKEEAWQDVTKTVIVQAKAGEIYFRDYKNLKDDVIGMETADGYNWVTNPKYFLDSNNILVSKANVRVGDGHRNRNPAFKRAQYFFVKDQVIITHYRGDESVADFRPHGNSKKNKKIFLRQASSVLASIDEISMSESSKKVYSDLTTKTEKGLTGVLHHPRDLKQVQNRAAVIRKDNEISANFHYNAILVDSVIGPNFARVIRADQSEGEYTVLISEDIRKEVDKIIRNSNEADQPLVLGYDTSFDAGGRKSGFVISNVTMSHPMLLSQGKSGSFDTNPTLTISSMLHVRRDIGHTHSTHIRTMNDVLKLQNYPSGVVIVVDKEFENMDTFPGAKVGLCWVHIKRDVSYNAGKHFGYK